MEVKHIVTIAGAAFLSGVAVGAIVTSKINHNKSKLKTKKSMQDLNVIHIPGLIYVSGDSEDSINEFMEYFNNKLNAIKSTKFEVDGSSDAFIGGDYTFDNYEDESVIIINNIYHDSVLSLKQLQNIYNLYEHKFDNLDLLVIVSNEKTLDDFLTKHTFIESDTSTDENTGFPVKALTVTCTKALNGYDCAIADCDRTIMISDVNGIVNYIANRYKL